MQSTNRTQEIATELDKYEPRNTGQSSTTDALLTTRRGGYIRKAPPTDPVFDDLLHLLSNQRRRTAIAAIDAHGPMTIKHLSASVASVEYDIPRDQLDSEQKRRVRIALYQTHLNRLDEAGVLTFENTRLPIGPGPHFERAVRVNEAAGRAFDGKPTLTLGERLAGVFS